MVNLAPDGTYADNVGIMENFADRLTRLMKRDRLKQAGVGAAIGKHQTRISALVNGADPSAEELVALAALFRVGEAWLLEGR
jgi:transcriptional regulator with XRE-family HTH domain